MWEVPYDTRCCGIPLSHQPLISAPLSANSQSLMMWDWARRSQLSVGDVVDLNGVSCIHWTILLIISVSIRESCSFGVAVGPIHVPKMNWQPLIQFSVTPSAVALEDWLFVPKQKQLISLVEGSIPWSLCSLFSWKFKSLCKAFFWPCQP